MRIRLRALARQRCSIGLRCVENVPRMTPCARQLGDRAPQSVTGEYVLAMAALGVGARIPKIDEPRRVTVRDRRVVAGSRGCWVTGMLCREDAGSRGWRHIG